MQQLQPARHLFAAVIAMAGLAWSPPTWADYAWLQRESGATVAQVGELGKPLPSMPVLQDVHGVLPDGKLTPTEAQGNRFVVPLGSGDMRFIATRAGNDGVLTYYQARIGRSETKAVNDLELVPTEAGGSTFHLFFKGRPANASRVNVETAAGWRKALTPNADGSITLDTPIPGLYVLEVTAKVNNASVSLDGKTYEDVRYTATLSFEVAR